MKSVLFLTAIMFAGAAAAQTYGTQSTTTTTTDPAATTTTTTVATAPATGQVVQPSNENPERDARGIPVISAPATVPPGFNNPPGMGGPLVDASQPAAPQPATGTPPPCTREVTDNCLQTYERGRSRH